jgi:hypothetical protein
MYLSDDFIFFSDSAQFSRSILGSSTSTNKSLDDSQRKSMDSKKDVVIRFEFEQIKTSSRITESKIEYFTVYKLSHFLKGISLKNLTLFLWIL